MERRAPASGITLDKRDAALVKGMLRRGDRQHDIAAWFGVNGGRVAEIATGSSYAWVHPAPPADLPPPGPYLSGREGAAALRALTEAQKTLAEAARQVQELGRGHSVRCQINNASEKVDAMPSDSGERRAGAFENEIAAQ